MVCRLDQPANHAVGLLDHGEVDVVPTFNLPETALLEDGAGNDWVSRILLCLKSL